MLITWCLAAGSLFLPRIYSLLEWVGLRARSTSKSPAAWVGDHPQYSSQQHVPLPALLSY